jgi:DNA-binding response OmpR family regulator
MAPLTGTDDIPPSVWIIASPGASADLPVLDDDGLLRHGGRWVSISDATIPLVDLLVRNLGRLVTSAEIHRIYTSAGGSGTATSLRSVIHRLGRRVAEVGLRLHVVRGRGVILDIVVGF